MRLSFTVSFLALFAFSRSTTSSIHARRSVTSQWSLIGSAPPQLSVPVQIFLREKNTDHAVGRLSEVSDPASSSYGRHWTPEQIADYFRPRQVLNPSHGTRIITSSHSQEAVAAVRSWLGQHGIDAYSLSASENRFDLYLNISMLETLLRTDYNIFTHTKSGEAGLGCDKYHLPSSLESIVDFIQPTVHLSRSASPYLHKRLLGLGLDIPVVSSVLDNVANVGKFISFGQPDDKHPVVGDEVPPQVADYDNGLADCDQTVTLACIRALYGIPNNNQSHPHNSFGILEFSPRGYIDADFDNFFNKYSPAQVGQRPLLVSIDGGTVMRNETDQKYYAESSLDLQYAMGLVHPQNVTLFQIGDNVQSGSFNTFLDAIDATYCKGDDKRFDPDYTQAGSSGGSQFKQDCGRFNATKTISISYGLDEATLPSVYLDRQCKEWLKFGLMGISVIVASGDSGVSGYHSECIDPESGDLNDGKSGKFCPLFLSSCPWVTSVGGTEIPAGKKIQDLRRVSNADASQEVAAKTKFYSGGGFSNAFPMPDYQKSLVGDWWNKQASAHNTSLFNQTRTRGSPDLSAVSSQFSTALQGKFKKLHGTSAAAPVIASMITLINGERLAAGKGTIGFVNPVLYQHPEVFQDVLEGSNPGCGNAGFTCAPGWDPVTGMGTPNYPKLLKVFMDLP